MKTYELRKCAIILIILLLALLITSCSSPSEPKNDASIVEPIVGNLYPYFEDLYLLVEGNNIANIFARNSENNHVRFVDEQPFEAYFEVQDDSGWITIFVDVTYHDEETESLSVTVLIDAP